MSFNIKAEGGKEDLNNALEQEFEKQLSEPAPGVRDLFQVGLEAVNNFAETSYDVGRFSATINGHATQNDGERDWLGIQIQAIQ